MFWQLSLEFPLLLLKKIPLRGYAFSEVIIKETVKRYYVSAAAYHPKVGKEEQFCSSLSNQVKEMAALIKVIVTILLIAWNSTPCQMFVLASFTLTLLRK